MSINVDIKFDNLHFEIMKELKKATKSVRIAVAWISFDLYQDIFKYLLSLEIKLIIICTNHKANRSYQSIIDDLKNLGADINIFTMPSSTNHMHHKFVIIDEKIILNGSFNWSKNAIKSFENVMIVKDDIKLIKKFMNEFEKIKSLNKENIRLLQKREKCSCGGYKVNILVFSNNPTKYNEAWGDVVQTCHECGQEHIIEYGVQDNTICFLLDSYETVDYLNEELENEMIIYHLDRNMDKYLNEYQLKMIIHAIGFVTSKIISPNGESEEYTKILWKNKFVTQHILNRYETTFGVHYD